MGNIQWGETKVTIERVEDPLNIVLEYYQKAESAYWEEERILNKLCRMSLEREGLFIEKGDRLEYCPVKKEWKEEWDKLRGREYDMFLENAKEKHKERIIHAQNAKSALSKIRIHNAKTKELEKKITELLPEPEDRSPELDTEILAEEYRRLRGI